MDNEINELQDLVKAAVAKARIEEALEYLGKIRDFLEDDEFEIKFLMLSSRHHQQKKEEVLGMPTNPENQNAIVNSIMILINDLKKAANGKGFYRNNYINRFYTEDLKNVDDVWELDRIMNSNTILIITGCNIFIELLDKVAAYNLKDVIDNLGNYHERKRSIIMGYRQFIADTDPKHSDDVQEKKLINSPFISIGGPGANPITQNLEESHDEIFNFRNFNFAYRNDNGIRKVAVWGQLAIDTQNAVEEFIRNKEKGLHYFLRTVWA